MRSLSCLVAACCLAQAGAFLLPPAAAPRAQRVPPAKVIPLELEGQLDPSKSWDVKMTFNGETKVVKVSEDTPILEAALKEWDVPNSCRNGICTTCAARVTAGAGSLKEAIHGLSPEQSQNGFVLTCQSHPAGPGLELELGMYDVVYETQYGQYERKGSDEGKKKKAFNVFG